MWRNEKESLCFYNGIESNEFEYLIALRTFDNKYPRVIDINTKLILYKNLVKVGDKFIDPISDEEIIRLGLYKVEIRKNYIKDFLAAYDKLCVIVFDHRRFFNKREDTKYKYDDIKGKNYFLNLSINRLKSQSNYDSYSSIIGKVLVLPYEKPRHYDYKYFSNKKEYEEFIIEYDDGDEEIKYICDEKELANYFGANPNCTNFLTEVYFDKSVLDKYKSNPKKHSISDSDISENDSWNIPFCINEQEKVIAWLGDLGRLPNSEQKYWKAFNIRPRGKIEKRFHDRQIIGRFTDYSRIESKLIPTMDILNELIDKKFGEILFKELSEDEKEIYNTFIIPTNRSITEYQAFLMKLSKIVAESINTNLIKKIMQKNLSPDISSINQLGEFLEFTKIDINREICESIKLAYNCRNKLSGHTASKKAYNKLWKRDKDFDFNSIEDSKLLLERIINSIKNVLVKNGIMLNNI